VKPLDRDVILQAIRKCRFVVTVEESALMAGFGSAVLEAAADSGIDTSHVRRLGIPDEFVEHGERGELLADLGLDAAGIAMACRTMAIRPAPTALPPGDRRHVARLGNLPQR
jgi:1-deoxy-D-xylulose-5-phosphate synthase